MPLPEFRANFSLLVLLKMLLAVVLVSVGLYLGRHFLHSLYVDGQLTQVGIVVNSAIAALFIAGLLNLFWRLIDIHREERALKQFLKNLGLNPNRPLVNIDPSRLIAERYMALDALSRSNTPINHSALAQILVANQSWRMSFIKFVHNILILLGVFGTIISLSIALLGASDMLGSLDNLDGMTQVIHGMSTALSTTITAILCYVIFGYFHIKTNDSQTRLIAAIEKLTAEVLMPRFQTSEETLVGHLREMLINLREVSESMRLSQEKTLGLEGQIHRALENSDARMAQMADDMAQMKRILQKGFRLSDQELDR